MGGGRGRSRCELGGPAPGERLGAADRAPGQLAAFRTGIRVAPRHTLARFESHAPPPQGGSHAGERKLDRSPRIPGRHRRRCGGGEPREDSRCSRRREHGSSHRRLRATGCGAQEAQRAGSTARCSTRRGRTNPCPSSGRGPCCTRSTSSRSRIRTSAASSSCATRRFRSGCRTELWAKYKLGEVFKIDDPATKAPSVRNVVTNMKAGDMPIPEMAMDKVQARGVVFGVCDLAMTVYSMKLAEDAKMKPEDVKKDLVAGLLPGRSFCLRESTRCIARRVPGSRTASPGDAPPLAARTIPRHPVTRTAGRKARRRRHSATTPADLPQVGMRGPRESGARSEQLR